MLSVEHLFWHISTTHLRWHALPSLQQKRSRRERPYNRPTFTESFNFTDEHVDIVSEEFDGLFHDVVGENLSFLEQDDFVSQDISLSCVEQPSFSAPLVCQTTCTRESSTFTESFNFTAEHVNIASKEFDGLFHDVVGESQTTQT